MNCLASFTLVQKTKENEKVRKWRCTVITVKNTIRGILINIVMV